MTLPDYSQWLLPVPQERLRRRGWRKIWMDGNCFPSLSRCSWLTAVFFFDLAYKLPISMIFILVSNGWHTNRLRNYNEKIGNSGIFLAIYARKHISAYTAECFNCAAAGIFLAISVFHILPEVCPYWYQYNQWHRHHWWFAVCPSWIASWFVLDVGFNQLWFMVFLVMILSVLDHCTTT